MFPPSSRTLAFGSLHRDDLADPTADTGQALLEDCDLLFSAEPVRTALELFLRHCQHAIAQRDVDTYEMLLRWTQELFDDAFVDVPIEVSLCAHKIGMYRLTRPRRSQSQCTLGSFFAWPLWRSQLGE